MRDPTRWRDNPDGLSPGAEALLRGARRPIAPGSHELARLGAAVNGIARAPAPAPTSWLRLGVAAAAAFAIVGGATFGWALHMRNLEQQREADAVERARVEREARRIVQPASLEHAVAIAPAPVAAAPAPVAVAPAARPARRHVVETRVAPAPIAAAAPTDSLAREVPLIDQGRSELAAAPSRALAVLETHRREFPRGQLAAEREFLAVQALLQMNRMADAKKRAEELATRYPSSSYAARASRLIDDAQAQRAAVPAHDGARGSERPGSQRASDRL